MISNGIFCGVTQFSEEWWNKKLINSLNISWSTMQKFNKNLALR